MKKRYLFLVNILLLSNVTNSQYCTAVGPSSTADSNLQSFNLAGESATSIAFTGCPGVIGLDNQTANETVTLNASGSYSASMIFGTCGGSFSGVGEGWIDYNQNSIFEPSESIGTWSGMPPVAANWNFTVPAGALSGITRMRVVHHEGGFLPIDPCAVFTWGSTTDFTVQIGGGMDCTPFVGESMTDPRPVSPLPFSETHSNAVCYYNVLTVYSSPDVYYRILPVQLGAQFITVSLCGSSIDTYLSILDEDGNVLYYNDDNDGCGTSSKIHFNAGTHDTLYAVVQGWGTATGSYSILVEEELASIQAQTSKVSFEIYPNPANEVIQVVTDEQNASISIHDISGKLVYSSTLQSNEPVDISTLISGTYFVTIKSENGIASQKLIIQ
ncbi:MAG: T9SS type A sorting domain-containing protein [Crocinitomicaceae bacterium]|nr:T9SS type A sorting domain-containing protein [Crocinitomicaceae bacterium]